MLDFAERRLDPDAVRRLEAEADRDLVVGGGTPVFEERLRLSLHLRDQRRFGNGMVYPRYTIRS